MSKVVITLSPKDDRPLSKKTENLFALKELVEVGKIKAVIDRCYPLE